MQTRIPRVLRWLYFLTACLLVQACGQKGPLYLPDDTQKTQSQKK